MDKPGKITQKQQANMDLDAETNEDDWDQCIQLRLKYEKLNVNVVNSRHFKEYLTDKTRKDSRAGRQGAATNPTTHLSKKPSALSSELSSEDQIDKLARNQA